MLQLRWKDDDITEVGIDECGRGCLWGPVCAAAVIWDMKTLPSEAHTHPLLQVIKDSKKLSPKKRAEAAEFIKTYAVAYTIQQTHANCVDDMNILQATLATMHRCLDDLNIGPCRILVDGTQFKKYKQCEHHCIIEGDNTYFSIAAASIIAKEFRDQWVVDMCEKDPSLHTRYNLKSCKGYGTKAHIEGIRTYGLHTEHRKTFGQCKPNTCVQ